MLQNHHCGLYSDYTERQKANNAAANRNASESGDREVERETERRDRADQTSNTTTSNSNIPDPRGIHLPAEALK